MMRVMMAGVLGLSLFAAPAFSEPALGLWLTEADRKGQVAHVSIQKCASALCGKIVKVFSPAGQEISHKNVGRMIFWGVTPTGGGAYQGRALVPAYNTEYDAEMKLSGNQLTVGGCKGPICQSQTWKRVK
ncbi:DUF2147 domain-containing protein [Roseovarius faecimaris]|uniref:DUF2147 domain-containing protein n=2 Tax=Roseovarius faecimaris TaxID=2494550 RepID=A0A6I6IPI0_9RHOB|nr:DUF2147 domain-containing protein [Roseovarius faecimaris]